MAPEAGLADSSTRADIKPSPARLLFVFCRLIHHFGPEVTQPVRLHVDAKRHQCTVHPEYLEQLSPASAKSFELQGGKMNAEELASFEQNPFFELALQLRQWDDQAKDPEKATPDLEHYLPLVKGTLVSAPASQ